MASTAIGIDIGHANVKVVELSRRSGLVYLQRAMLLPLAPGTIAGGLLIDKDALRQALAQAASALRWTRPAVVAGLTGSQVYVRTFQAPANDQVELNTVVNQEFAAAMRIQPLEIDQYALDYALIQATENSQREVLMVGMRKETVVAYARTMRAAHLPPCVVDLAVFELPMACPIEGFGVFIEIGTEHTQVLAVHNGEYLLYRLIPVGMRRLTDGIAAAYDLPIDQAIQLQRSRALADLVAEAPGSKGALRVAMQEMAGGVGQTLEFLRARRHAPALGEAPSTVILSGGGALQKGLRELLSSEISVEIEVARPFSGFPGAEHLQTGMMEIEPQFAGAMGLALRGLDE